MKKPTVLALLLATASVAVCVFANGQDMMRVPVANEGRPDVNGQPARDLWFVLQTQHARTITDVDVTSNGRFLLTVGDATPRIWDVETARVLSEITGHNRPVTSGRFSPDGKRVLTSGLDSFVRLWDWQTGKLDQTFGPHLRIIDQSDHDLLPPAEFSKDGTHVITAGVFGRTTKRPEIAFWSIANGKRTRSFGEEGHEICTFCQSSDGKFIATGDSTGGIRIWNVENGEITNSLEGHSMRVNSIEFSSNGEQLLSASEDRTARIWNVSNGNEEKLLAGHFHSIHDASFSPDGKQIGTCGDDSTARIWDVATGKETARFRINDEFLQTITFSEDGRSIVTAGSGRIPRVHEISSGEIVKSFVGYAERIDSAVMDDNGEHLLAVSDDAVRVWDLKFGRPTKSIDLLDRNNIRRVVVSPDATRFLAIHGDESVIVYDIQGTTQTRSLEHNSKSLHDVIFSGDSKRIITSSRDGTIAVWSAESLGQQFILNENEDSGVDAVPEEHEPGSDSVVADADKKIKLVSSPDGELLLTVDQTSIQFWDMKSGKPVGKLRDVRPVLNHVSFSDDGQLILTLASQRKQINEHNKFQSPFTEFIVWDATTHKQVGRIEMQGHQSLARIAPDKKHLVVANDKTISMLELNTGNSLHDFEGHDEVVHSIRFSSDGKWLVSSSADQTCRFWDVQTGKQTALLACMNSGGWAVIDDAGRFDGSNGGEFEGLHWVVEDQTIGLNQLKNRYYEPKLLAKVLGFDTEPRRQVAGFTVPELYPEVKVSQADFDDGSVKIELRNSGGGIGRVFVRLNGKELQADARGNRVDPNANQATLEIDLSNDPRLKPGEDNLIEVVAYNAEDYLASPVRGLRVRKITNPENQREPELWAVIAGVSDYQGETIDLRYAAKDAEDFAAALRIGSQRLFGADRVHLTLLSTDLDDSKQHPTRQNLLAALKQIERSATANDILVIYLSGHGINHGGQDGDFYYLTSDAQTAELTDPALREQVAISSAQLSEQIKNIPALKQVLILDTCAAGRLITKLTEQRNVPSSQLRAMERVKDRTGMYVLAGCAADSVSFEASQFGQGLLTHSLLLGMRGAALRENEYIDVSTLFNFSADHVPQLAKDIGGIQRPVVANPKGGASFDLGRISNDDRNLIPVQLARPMIVRSNFQDEVEFDDTLGLATAVNSALRNVAARGPNGPFVFIDGVQIPNAYRLAGRYSVNDGKIEVTVHVFIDNKRAAQFKVNGVENDLADLANQIIDRAQEHLGSN